MNRFIKFFIFILLFLAFFPFMKQTLALSNQANISVQVSQITQISVIPTSLSWTLLPKEEGSIKWVEIKNTGSTNITLVYAYVDTLEKETSKPSASAQDYAAGGVLVIKKDLSDEKFYYAGRIEWNVSKPTGAGNTNCANAIAWGYYRNVTGDYLWCLVNASDGTCNNTNAKIYIENDTDAGTSDTRDPDIGGSFTQAFKDWAVYNFSSGPLQGHCVAAYWDCSKIYIYRYDARSEPNFAACDLTALEQSLNTSAILYPSNSFLVSVSVWVPEIPYGWMKPSLLTFEAL